MKIVLIGGGSYVFAPTVLYDAIVRHRLSDCELVLVDTNEASANAIMGLGMKMAKDMRCGISIRVSTERKDSLSGADFVILSASVQGTSRWSVDYQILKEAGIAEQARENGGMGGLTYALRSISLALDICRDMERLCPKAMLLDVTNPMPRVVTAINKYSAISALGFCNIAWVGASGYEWLAGLLGRQAGEIKVVSAGLNHFSWLVSIQDRLTGQDLLEEVKHLIRTGESREFVVLRHWLEEYGAVAAGVVDHHAEYLPYTENVHYHDTPPFHGSEEKRKKRLADLHEMALGRLDWRGIVYRGSWEHPVDVAVAIDQSRDIKLDMINMPNQSYLPQLPDGCTVEIPAIVTGGKVIGTCVPQLPGNSAEVCRSVSVVHELVAEAAATGSRLLLEQAIEADIAITDKKASIFALDRMMAAHADVLTRFRQHG